MAKKQSETYQELLKEYRKLAKRADQRLVRIEQRAAAGEHKEMLKYAYKKAMVDIRKWSGPDAKRFNVVPPVSKNKTVSLKAKIRDIKQFLESPSSTIAPAKENYVYNLEGEKIPGGIRNIYERRAQTLNQKFGEYLDTPFTSANIGDFFDSALWKKLDAKFKDSKTTMRAIGTIKKNKEQVASEINRHKPSHIDVDDMVLDKRVKHILRYYKKDLTKLF